MKNHSVERGPRFLLPRILAVVLATFWAVGQASAAEVQLNRISENVVEITGGSGRAAWRIRYGTGSLGFKPQLIPVEGNRAWYAYGPWLRLIDTEKGIVIGRWHFGSEIVDLVPRGTKVQVELQDKGEDQPIRRSVVLDPSDPHVPFWPSNNLLLLRVPLTEADMLWPSVIRAGSKVPAEEAHKLLPELEEAVRRDPLTPWFRIGLAKALKDIGDPRSTEIVNEAISLATTDYTELLRISSFLDRDGDYDLERAAFERGYQDFWQRGNDPRLFRFLITLLMTYAPRGGDFGHPETPLGREHIERKYKLMPYGEAAPFAWQLYADYLATHGSADQARLWRMRAADAFHQSGLLLFAMAALGRTDLLILLVLCSALAAIAYALVLNARYRPQSRMDLAAHKHAAGLARIAAFLNAHYWSRRERFAFFTIIVVGWVSFGFAGEDLSAILRVASMPIAAGSGSFAGPVTINKFQRDLPETPERDLMLAFAYQQDGQLDGAEFLYRHTPQFAESWNNLGVILKQKGNDQEAKTAFEKALQLNPKLHEAALNLGQPPSDFWTEQHEKYLPGKPMLTPPSGPHITIAYMGGSLAQVLLRALAGPFSVENFGQKIKVIWPLYD